MAVKFSERVARPARGAKRQVPRVRRNTHIDDPDDLTQETHGWSSGVGEDVRIEQRVSRAGPPKPPRARRTGLEEDVPAERLQRRIALHNATNLDADAIDEELDRQEQERELPVRTTPAPPKPRAFRQRLTPEQLPHALPAKPTVDAKVGLTLRPIADDDLDRLWDWVRLDKDTAAGFLDPSVTTSKGLHAKFAEIAADCETGKAAAYAIDRIDVQPNPHIGFLILSPIMAADKLALTHLYIAAPLRGRLAELAPELFLLAQTEHPTLSCLIKTKDAAMARLLGRLGFDVTYMLTKRT